MIKSIKPINFSYTTIFWILATITCFVYLPTLHFPFQFDDLPNILNYTKLKSQTLSATIFSQRRWLVIWLNQALYRIVEHSSFAYRLINLGTHIASGTLIFWLIKRFNNLKHAAVIGLLTSSFFLLHPVQTQTVSYVIQGQLEGLTTLFGLICIAAFRNYIVTIKPTRKLAWLLLLFCSLTCAVSTKEISLIIPFLILLTDWFWFSQGDPSKLSKRIWLHTLITGFTFGFLIYYLKPSFLIKILGGQQSVPNAAGNMINTNIGANISQTQFALSQFKVILHYLWIFLWPRQICMEYDWSLCQNWYAIDCLLPLLILIVLGVIIIRLLCQNRTHPIAFGLLWFLVCILPRSSIIASNELLVDYKTYCASIGWLFVIAYIFNYLLNIIKHKFKFSGLIYTASIAATLTLFAIGTSIRNQVWGSGLNFWGDVIAKVPNKARGFNNYGMALVELGKYHQSIFYFKRALELSKFDQSTNFYWDPYQNLANVYALTGNVDQGIEIIELGLRINPNIAELHGNLGALLLHKLDYARAIKHLKIALQLKPNLGPSLYALGKAYAEIGQLELAWETLHRACQNTYQDRSIETLQLYSELSIRLQKYDCAIWALQKIVALESRNQNAWLNLAAAYYFNQEVDKAKKCYTQILQSNPNNQIARQKLNLIQISTGEIL